MPGHSRTRPAGPMPNPERSLGSRPAAALRRSRDPERGFPEARTLSARAYAACSSSVKRFSARSRLARLRRLIAGRTRDRSSAVCSVSLLRLELARIAAGNASSSRCSLYESLRLFALPRAGGACDAAATGAATPARTLARRRWRLLRPCRRASPCSRCGAHRAAGSTSL